MIRQIFNLISLPKTIANINSSSEIDSAPDEDVKINTNNNNKNRVPVAPIHVPDKPVSNNQHLTKTNALTTNSSSVEKPNPNPVKSKIVKQPPDAKDS